MIITSQLRISDSGVNCIYIEFPTEENAIEAVEKYPELIYSGHRIALRRCNQNFV